MKKLITKTSVILLLGMQLACAPEFLDIKPNKALVVPSQLAHYQALLDAATVAMNQGPGLQVLAGDEFYHPESNINNLNFIERNSYLWAERIFEGKGALDWEYPYKAIFNANIAIDGLSKIKRDAANQKEWDQIYGSALFYRAFSVYSLADVFAAPYRQTTAGDLPGIPYRTEMDVNQITGRGTLQQTYEKIINDLVQADELLDDPMRYVHRPSGVAVKAALARIYLSMGQYDQAQKMATAALAIQGTLLDYNALNPASARQFPSPFAGTNYEIIFHYNLSGYSLVSSPLTGVDTLLYRSYHKDDLRKSYFFVQRPSGAFGFKGSYSGGAGLYGGLVTDELYLIRAECYARKQQVDLALTDLNLLLSARFKKDTFVPLTATSETILELVLTERKKELLARGLRWSDLRRLNQDPRFAITLRRTVKGVEYELPPNNNRYVFPIPDDEIPLSGIEQNPR